MRNAARSRKAKKAEAVRTHDVTLEVGSSIVIDPAGERLLIKEISGDRIVFEQAPDKTAHP